MSRDREQYENKKKEEEEIEKKKYCPEAEFRRMANITLYSMRRAEHIRTARRYGIDGQHNTICTNAYNSTESTKITRHRMAYNIKRNLLKLN